MWVLLSFYFDDLMFIPFNLFEKRFVIAILIPTFALCDEHAVQLKKAITPMLLVVIITT